MKLLAVLGLIVFLVSCGGESTPKVEIDPNGPEVEINVLSFDQENRKTEIEIINRMDDPIKAIKGRLYFYDTAGELLTTATGRDLSSPFSLVSNPSIVKSMDRVERTIKNQIPEGTASIKVEEIGGQTTSGDF
jgi:hypothetical protein